MIKGRIKFSLFQKGLYSLAYGLLILLSWVIFITVALANPEITATVDRTNISLNEQIQLTITITGGKASEPDLPLSQDFNTSFQGTSSQIQMINGNTTSTESYIYQVSPTRSGSLTIGKISTIIDGKKYYTEPIKIEVTKTSQNSNISQNDEVFVTAEVDNKTPFVNQEIIYSFKVFRRVATANNNVTFPEFKDFWTEDMGKEINYEQIIKGQKYAVAEIKKALFPIKSGNIKINPANFKVEIIIKDDDTGFGGFFSQSRTETKEFSSSPLNIDVKPLPAGKPANFSNLVGSDISFESDISHKDVNAGDSVTLNLKIQGKGNINDLKTLPLTLNNTKIYQDKPVAKSFIQNNELYMGKILKYALVPLKSGKLEIPPLKLSYFNPKTKRYETLSTKPVSLSVTGSVDDTLIGNLQGNIKNNDNLFNIHQGFDSLKNSKISLAEKLLLIIWFLLPPLILWIVFLLKSGKLKSLKAPKLNNKNNYKLTLEKLNKLSENGEDGNELPEKLTSIFKNYLINKFDLPKESIFYEDVGKNITGKLPLEISKEISSIFESYQFLKFSGSKLSNDKKKEIIESTRELLNRLESVKK